MSIIRKAALAIAAIAAVSGLALGGATAAGASQVATHYSQYLAGHAMQGNGSQAFEAVWGGVTVPGVGVIPSDVPPDTVAVGLVMAASSVNPSYTNGLGLVWDDTTQPGTCGLGQWTLEAGSTPAMGLQPGPVPTSNLHPLSESGPICVSPGGYLWMKMQQSTRHGIMSYIVGPSEHNNDVVDQVSGVHEHFLSTGEGVTTTTLAADDDLADGTTFSFDTWAVTDLASHHAGAHATNRNALAFNYATFVGTQDGSAPTPGNPVTLQPSSFTKVGYGSANTITVP